MHLDFQCESARNPPSVRVICRAKGGDSSVFTQLFRRFGRLQISSNSTARKASVCLLSLVGLLLVAPAIWGQEKPGNPKSATTPVLPRDQTYQSISAKGRLRWFVKSTIGLESLSGGLISAAWGTGFDNPREYGPGWEGFGKRYGMRLTGVSTGNAMEAAAGALWGEDPRYFRAAGQPFGARVKNIIRFTFVAYRADGSVAPAYARFAANAGNNFLSNTWRARSESDSQHAVIRIGEGVLGKMAANAFAEFWPDAKRLMFHRH
jgi:hypothetical protein